MKWNVIAVAVAVGLTLAAWGSAKASSGEVLATKVLSDECSPLVAQATPVKEPVKFLQQIDAAYSEKDEFQSRDEHEQSLRAKLKKVGIDPDALYAVTLPIESWELKFDAERGVLVWVDQSIPSYTIRDIRTGDQSYVAQNAFGVSVRVTRELRSKMLLVADVPLPDTNGEFRKGWNGEQERDDILFPMSGAEAKAALTSAKITLVFHLAYPFIERDVQQTEATVRYPHETRTTYRMVQASLTCAVAHVGGYTVALGGRGSGASASIGQPSATSLTSGSGQATAVTDWVAQPSGDDLARYYPDRAQRLERSGNAVLQCQVGEGGALRDCHVVSEDPPDYGFGDAALRASKLYRARLRPATDELLVGPVTLTVPFTLPN